MDLEWGWGEGRGGGWGGGATCFSIPNVPHMASTPLFYMFYGIYQQR